MLLDVVFPAFARFVLIVTTITQANGAKSKITRSLSKSIALNSKANVLVTMQEGTSSVLQNLAISNGSSINHVDRAEIVRDALMSHASSSQSPVLSLLEKTIQNTNSPMKFKSFWITNQIYIQNVDVATLDSLASLGSVAEISEEETTHIRSFYTGESQDQEDSNFTNDMGHLNAVQWGLRQMRVPEVWSLPNGGFDGTGLIIGNIDTGVRGTHELLRRKWIGPSGGWYDPYRKSRRPSDVYNHGTHTMGTLVGGDGIGAAPGARWTACKGYDDKGGAQTSAFLACGQFMLCPTDTQGNNADCSKTPHVVSNSWGYYGGVTVFNRMLEAWNSAGILSSFSAGNTAECSSIYSPADQPMTIAVGASGENNGRAGFSSRGPSGDGSLKPEISAPGVSVYSASSRTDTAYMTASGTSMSCPHASGVLALMKAADRSLTNDKARHILKETANRNVRRTGESCGGINDEELPNNSIGFGIVDAYAAVSMVLSEM